MQMSRAVPLMALIFGNIILALGPWLVRLSDTGPVATGFWRVALALPFCLMIALWQKEKPFALPRKKLGLVLLAGVFFGLDIMNWHAGIEMTRLANATVFGNAGSIIMMVWGFVVLARFPNSREWTALGCAAIGIAILLGRSLEISSTDFAGDLLCLAAGLLYVGYLMILQNVRQGLGGWSLLFWACVASSCVLLPATLLFGENLFPSSWGPLFALSLSSQVIGQGLLIYSLRHFSPLIIGLALLTQPAVAAITGWLAFGEMLTPLDGFGIAMVGAALVLAKTASPAKEEAVQKP